MTLYEPDDAAATINVDELLVIVVGAHLRAEIGDRPRANALRQRIVAWQASHQCPNPLTPVVCTDLWYLNDRDLQSRPTIAVGNPSVNAVSAWLANRLPTAFVVEQEYEIQLDVELLDQQACVWGIDHERTAAAVAAFIDRWLEAFLRAAHGMVSGAA